MLFENVEHGWCVFNLMDNYIKSISYCCNPLEEIYYALENKIKHNFPFQVEFDCEDKGKQGLIEFGNFTYIFARHYYISFVYVTYVDDVTVNCRKSHKYISPDKCTWKDDKKGEEIVIRY